MPRAGIALLFVVAGCYSPSPLIGVSCSAALTCPDTLICIAGKCVAEAAESDAPTDSPATCTPIEAGTGKLNVPRVDGLVVDGDLSDWTTCFVTVDQSSAGLVRDLGAGGRFAEGRFSIATDGDRVYVAAEVNSVLPLGDEPLPAVYQNNAISVYFDGDGSFTTMAYGADAAQIVVDHANRMQAFRSPGGDFDVPDVIHAARTTASTFIIEMSVTPATFGRAAFGTPIGFDIGLVGGDGATMTSELVWFRACAPPQCECTNGDAAPYCDNRMFGTATLE